jgi:hypothetical protein
MLPSWLLEIRPRPVPDQLVDRAVEMRCTYSSWIIPICFQLRGGGQEGFFRYHSRNVDRIAPTFTLHLAHVSPFHSRLFHAVWGSS